MAKKKIKVKLLRENSRIPTSNNGNWYDCYVSAAVVPNLPLDWERLNNIKKTSGIIRFKPGDIVVVYLGFSADIGKGYEAIVAPRSSTFNKYGLILANSIGVIDDTFNGDEDEWRGVFYATRHSAFKIGDRLLQMRIQKSLDVEMDGVDELGNPSRGGFGTTGD